MTDTAVKTTWAIDPTHTEVQFKVKHLVISTVTGYFREFEGSLEAAGDSFEGASIRFSAKTGSVDTNNSQRDEHLRSDDFFNASAYPELTFQSDSFKSTGDNRFELTGDLTIRDVTKQVTLQAEYNGTMVDPWGNTKAGFEINGVINRKAFGLRWSAVTEAGGAVVSDEVRLHINVELAKQ